MTWRESFVSALAITGTILLVTVAVVAGEFVIDKFCLWGILVVVFVFFPVTLTIGFKLLTVEGGL